ncbi:MAG: polyphosphate kinase 2 family protein [Acidobacteriota bacterium]|nr:polyphosphate kinase 2 family protein [Acidobacteriota bacterium]
MNLTKRFAVNGGKNFQLAKYDPDDSGHIKDKSIAAEETLKLVSRLDHLQDVLYAEHKRAVLIVLQGMDASGKDGTIRHVMSGVNPQGCSVTSFKQPTSHELDHDFLWRIHQVTPAFGMIGIFNRSHYEDVLVVRVHQLVEKSVWEKRYEQINNFEKMLAENGTVILKFFLNLGKDEQKKRFDARHDDPDKNWKSSPADEAERKYWDDYQAAYQDVLANCSKPHAPWYVIPANRKWFRNLAISQILVHTLEGMDLKYPTVASTVPKAAGKK